MLKQIFGSLICVVGAALAVSAMLGLLGAGLVRNGPPVLVALVAVALVSLPVRALMYKSGNAHRPSLLVTGLAMVVWSSAVLVTFPLYFPGERGSSLSLGFAAIGTWTQGRVDGEWGRRLDEWLPRIEGTRKVLAEARTEAPPLIPPVRKSGTQSKRDSPSKASSPPRVPDEVVLPTEGGKSALRVPVTLEGPKRQLEVSMLFDTGATLTTLNRASLRKIGISVPRDAPEMTMQTAAGPQTAQLVMLDRLWVGGLEVEGVTVSVCEPCATDGTVGLLGLNVSDRFLVTVDGARSEISLRKRDGATDRSGDVSPWIGLDAEGVRWPDGHSEVIVEATNRSSRWIDKLTIAIHCQETRYADILDVGPGQLGRVEVSVDASADCSNFRVELVKAQW